MTQATLTIITGHSRGLGQALAAALLQRAQPGDCVLGIARQPSAHLQVLAAHSPAHFEQWQADLADAAPVAQRLEQWLAGRKQAQASAAGAAPAQPAPTEAASTEAPPTIWRELRLINNAGLIPAIAPLSQLGSADITQGLRVGLEAAMLLCAAFLRASENWPAPPGAAAAGRKVLNISSGLGRRPMAAQAVYCAAKAGMDLYTRCLALEEAARPEGARVASLAPGVIATDMQQHLCSARAQDFPDLPRFQSLLENGQLQTPEATAQAILQRLDAPGFGEPVIDDVRQ
ncbi:MAG: SDR family NAD(P)-dependent oxidoreductase [Comamonadaceae bacterium]|nr:SDR family NAD(P)-dependent oxidoreductase [Comamonadaceae bacterium]